MPYGTPLYKTDALEIEKVQRRATKLVPELRKLDYSERLKALSITTLAYRRRRTDVLQVFRIIKGIDKIPFETFFQYNTSGTRGHHLKLEKPRATTKLRQNSFSHRAVNIWNSLPADAVISKTINSFKNALEKFWKDDPLKYTFE